MQKTIDVQGHRGCRCFMPEITIPAFIEALELGVTTLEMDLVISQDHQVMISHEPFFNHEISTDPNGVLISEEEEKSHNMYKMDYSKIQTYDVGTRAHPRFLNQQKFAATKPKFSQMVSEVKSWCKNNNKALPYFNIEIKRKEGYDDLYHPNAQTFAQLVIDQVNQLGIKKQTYIQSFDINSLKASKEIDPIIKLVLLIENKGAPEDNLDLLGFKPDVYSPYFKLIDEKLITLCKERNIQLIPWTVNEKEDMEQMISFELDGIITDFPDVLIQLLKEKNIAVKH